MSKDSAARRLSALPDSRPLEQKLFAAAEGDMDALRSIYEETRAPLYGYALSILRSPHDAEEVLHDAYIRVWSSASAYRGGEKPMAWLFTITRNLAISRLRERERLSGDPLEETSWYASAVSGLDEGEAAVIRALLDELNGEEREIVSLHALSGFRHREIADLLSLPLSTVLSKYHRAMKKLRAILKED